MTTGAPPLVGTCDGRRLLSYEQAQGDGSRKLVFHPEPQGSENPPPSSCCRVHLLPGLPPRPSVAIYGSFIQWPSLIPTMCQAPSLSGSQRKVRQRLVSQRAWARAGFRQDTRRQICDGEKLGVRELIGSGGQGRLPGRGAV